VIVPTLAYEIFGMVVIEAFSHGTPAIVRKTGGMPELIEDSGGGFVYTTDAELAGIMSRLLDDPALRREVGARGFQAYLKNWTPDVHLDRYLGLIRQIADARGRPLGTQSTATAVSGPVS
jgi:glycosyltransferase involved in cell wall biosynthesis